MSPRARRNLARWPKRADTKSSACIPRRAVFPAPARPERHFLAQLRLARAFLGAGPLFPGAGFDADPLSAPRLRRPGLKKLDLCNRLAQKKGALLIPGASGRRRTSWFRLQAAYLPCVSCLAGLIDSFGVRTPAKWFRGECQCGGNFTGVPPPPRREAVWKEGIWPGNPILHQTAAAGSS